MGLVLNPEIGSTNQNASAFEYLRDLVAVIREMSGSWSSQARIHRAASVLQYAGAISPDAHQIVRMGSWRPVLAHERIEEAKESKVRIDKIKSVFSFESERYRVCGATGPPHIEKGAQHGKDKTN